MSMMARTRSSGVFAFRSGLNTYFRTLPASGLLKSTRTRPALTAVTIPCFPPMETSIPTSGLISWRRNSRSVRSSTNHGRDLHVHFLFVELALLLRDLIVGRVEEGLGPVGVHRPGVVLEPDDVPFFDPVRSHWLTARVVRKGRFCLNLTGAARSPSLHHADRDGDPLVPIPNRDLGDARDFRDLFLRARFVAQDRRNVDRRSSHPARRNPGGEF